jgi:hypothetical protein
MKQVIGASTLPSKCAELTEIARVLIGQSSCDDVTTARINGI